MTVPRMAYELPNGLPVVRKPPGHRGPPATACVMRTALAKMSRARRPQAEEVHRRRVTGSRVLVVCEVPVRQPLAAGISDLMHQRRQHDGEQRVGGGEDSGHQ